MTICCHQVNLQTGWGGGEVYTVFFTRALMALGIPTILYVNQKNPHWTSHLPASVKLVGIEPSLVVGKMQEVASGWFLFHSPLSPSQLAELRDPARLLSCIAHMPLYGRNPDRIAAHDYVIGVSSHVLDSLRDASINHYHSEPLLGVADLMCNQKNPSMVIKQRSRYDWDLRKARDRLFSWLYPLLEIIKPARVFEKRNGITLGIVSRITPIKQFPLLLSLLVPVIARYPEFNLEIFGAGGYASVRDLDKVLEPIKSRVRFWGHQTSVTQVYKSIDYLITGLPEKEALGLNVIEAQVCGTPVLAVGSKPFTETVKNGITGRFYIDPRQDNGGDFDALLGELLLHPFRIDMNSATEHLEQFSERSFQGRVQRLCDVVQQKLRT